MPKPSRRAVKLAAAVLLLAPAFTAAALLMALATPAPLGFWERVGRPFGQALDLGPVDFATLTPPPGTALICPADICPAASQAIPSPVFTISAERLATKLRRYALGEVGVEEAPADEPGRLRFVHRSLLLRLPEVIDARIVARSSGAASVALYARPVIGALDFGASRARMERWMEALSR